MLTSNADFVADHLRPSLLDHQRVAEQTSHLKDHQNTGVPWEERGIAHMAEEEFVQGKRTKQFFQRMD